MNARDAPATRVAERLPIPLGTDLYYVDIWQLQSRGVTLYFVDHPGLFGRAGVYGDQRGDFPDNHIRFAVLSKAAIEIARRLFAADILHCHDWQASLVPAYLKDARIVDPGFLDVRTLLTIIISAIRGFSAGATCATSVCPTRFIIRARSSSGVTSAFSRPASSSRMR